MKASKAVEFFERIRPLYPKPCTELEHSNPFELLVATILSAQTTDKRVNMVTGELFKQYRTPEDFAKLTPAQLQPHIRSVNFFRTKARNIIGAAKIILRKHHGRVPRTMEEMIELPGVSRKTANLVLGLAFGVASGIVVDTHVYRITLRLGLHHEKTPEKAERKLMEQVPQNLWIHFGTAMLLHGRYVCRARPNCPECVLNRVCPSSTVSRETPRT